MNTSGCFVALLALDLDHGPTYVAVAFILTVSLGCFLMAAACKIGEDRKK